MRAFERQTKGKNVDLWASNYVGLCVGIPATLEVNESYPIKEMILL